MLLTVVSRTISIVMINGIRSVRTGKLGKTFFDQSGIMLALTVVTVGWLI